MKTLIFVLASLLTYNSLYAKTLIVTDVDDTVKVTDVLSKTNAVYNALFSKAAFAGMSELYRQLDTKENIFYYVSGSPQIIESKVSSFLEFNNFPQNTNLILKSGLSAPTYEYKVAAITQLIQKLNPDKVILIGDDTEFDPEIYERISKDFPTKVESVYIRAIQDRALPKLDGIRNFFSAVEIAVLELNKGNLSSASLSKVAASFVQKSNGAKFYIKGRYCPSEGRVQIEELKQSAREQSVINALELTQETIITTCK